MQLDNYLQSQSSEGRHDSQGSFTLDLTKAADRLTQFRLPSPHHYLLKLVQIAAQLGAEEVHFKMERFRTKASFRAPRSGSVTDSAALKTAFLDPLEIEDPLLGDLVTALFGCLTEDNLEVLWSYSEGHRGQRVFIKGNSFECKDFELTRPLQEDLFPCAFTLSVLHPRTWMFWKLAPRITAAISLIERACPYSRMQLWLDGRKLDPAASNTFATHRGYRPHYVHTSASRLYRPYHVVLYQTEDGDQAFRLQRPSAANYVTRERDVNVWASGTRLRNTLKPDGVSSPAWFLQFLDEKENLPIRQVPKVPRCRVVLAYDFEEAQEGVPVRLTLVRNSVVVLSESLEGSGQGIPELQGCHVVLHDSDLATDLTGFQVLQDEEFRARLRALIPLVTRAGEYFRRGMKIVPSLRL